MYRDRDKNIASTDWGMVLASYGGSTNRGRDNAESSADIGWNYLPEVFQSDLEAYGLVPSETKAIYLILRRLDGGIGYGSVYYDALLAGISASRHLDFQNWLIMRDEED